MKHLFTIAAVAACLLSFTNANAKIRRVGYAGPHINNTDYADLKSAHDAANNGDTIMLYPGNWGANYSKKLVTIGYGYLIDTVALGTGANKGLQNIVGPLAVDITLVDGSGGCVFEGIDGLTLGNNPSGFHYYNTDNITVKRSNCYIKFRNYTHSNWKIIQSFVSIGVNPNDGVLWNNLLVSNCIIGNFTTNGTNTSQTGIFINNVFTGGWSGPSFAFKNNIFFLDYDGPLAGNSTYNYNVFVGNISGTINGSHNKINKDASTIFIGYPDQKKYSNDFLWKLKPNSPATGAGENGIDCGIYASGSAYPYKLSGIPSIPAFYLLSAPSTTTGSGPTYQITFSVRSNN